MFLNRGLAEAASGFGNRAIADFGRAIALEPNFAAAFYQRGLAYRAVGQTDQAAADLAQARRLDPSLMASTP